MGGYLCLLDISGSLLSLQNSAITIVITAVNTCSPLPAVVNTVFFFWGGGGKGSFCSLISPLIRTCTPPAFQQRRLRTEKKRGVALEQENHLEVRGSSLAHGEGRNTVPNEKADASLSNEAFPCFAIPLG